MTSLAGGTRVPKHHARIEAYGTLDELSAVTGMLHALVELAPQRDTLLRIQRELMVLEAILATPEADKNKTNCDSGQGEVHFLEQEIDRLSEDLAPLRTFLLPGGHPVIAWCHLARTIGRRAERAVSRVDENEPQDPCILAYLNRLSDYYFILSRWSAQQLGITEIPWIPEGRQ